ncbi:inositol phosphate phosphatase SopB [Rouxiella badensis]
MQAQNTSASGNKVLKNIPLSAINLSYDARVGDHQVWKETQGLSKLV